MKRVGVKLSQERISLNVRSHGFLKIYIGPMFSQKTRNILTDLEMLARSNCSVLYVNHSADTRSDVASVCGLVTTHQEGFTQMPDGISSVSVSRLSDISPEQIALYDTIGVDECQFFPDLKEVVTRWVNEANKHVVCAGLDGDAFMSPFGQTLDLIPICDKVKKLRAKCTFCRKELERLGYQGDPLAISAPFTLRIAEGQGQVLIGGSSSYTAVCRSHHISQQPPQA